MSRGGNFGRGKMICDPVHLILCVDYICSLYSGVNSPAVKTQGMPYLSQEGMEEAVEEMETTDLVGTVSLY